MAKAILVLLLINCMAFKEVISDSAAEEKSYVEDLVIEFKNDRWTCGTLHCLSAGTGCHIIIQNDKRNASELLLSYECIGDRKLSDWTEVPAKRKIDIDLTTVGKAGSQYEVLYDRDGFELAKGVVTPSDLPQLKEKFRKSKKQYEYLARYDLA